jgi:hypothetical protein
MRNALGTFQANVGIWQILARQRQITKQRLNDSWQTDQTVCHDSATAKATRRGPLAELFRFSTGKRRFQDEIIDLLADLSRTRRKHASGDFRPIRSCWTTTTVSLDTILTLGDALAEKARNSRQNT